MTSPTYCTFDGDPGNGIAPYRPASADVGGAEWVDDQAYPPIPDEQMGATDANQMATQIVRLGRMTTALSLEIVFLSAGTPSIDGFACANDAIALEDFTVTYPATGQVRVAWPEGSLPPLRVGPLATVHSADAIIATVVQASYQIDVYIATYAGVAAEASVRVDVDGE